MIEFEVEMRLRYECEGGGWVDLKAIKSYCKQVLPDLGHMLRFPIGVDAVADLFAWVECIEWGLTSGEVIVHTKTQMFADEMLRETHRQLLEEEGWACVLD